MSKQLLTNEATPTREADQLASITWFIFVIKEITYHCEKLKLKFSLISKKHVANDASGKISSTSHTEFSIILHIFFNGFDTFVLLPNMWFSFNI